MNIWIEKSLDLANNSDYYDKLYSVYPIKPGPNRSIEINQILSIEKHFISKNDKGLFLELSKLEKFPIKDSFVALLKKEPNLIDKNPKNLKRICELIYDMGLSKLKEEISEPKETNRQIGPMFKNWLRNGEFCIPKVEFKRFSDNLTEGIMIGTDEEMKKFAKNEFNYLSKKGLDFIAKKNNKFIIGETKFLTDVGGHQNAQFNDAVNLFNSDTAGCTKIAILDGILYIKSGKMYNSIINDYKDKNILSSLLINDFLKSF